MDHQSEFATRGQNAQDDLGRAQSGKTCTDFLCRLQPTGYWLLAAIDPKTGHIEIKTFDARTVKDAIKWIDFWQGKRNIYFSVNQPRGPMTKKAGKKDITSVEVLHVDIDPADPPNGCSDTASHNAAERKRILAALKAYKPTPSLIIDSGGGYQGFWLLDEPVAIKGPDDMAMIEARNKQISKDLGGDNCHNIDRIMRLPGTVNLPNAKKRAKGRVVAMAGLVAADWDRTWALTDFAAVDTADPTNAPREATGQRGDPPEWCQRLIKDGPDSSGPYSYNGDRSRAVFAVCCTLVRCGFTDEEIAAAISDPANRISGHVLAQSKPEAYALRQAIKARAKVTEREVIGTMPDWRERRKKGPVASLHNACLAIGALGVECSYDTFHNKMLLGIRSDAKRHDLEPLIGELSDNGLTRLRWLISNRFGFDPLSVHVHDAVKTVAQQNCFDPVWDMLAEAESAWDGIVRLDRMAVDHFNSDNTPLHCACVRKSMIAAVRRVRQPGCKFDTMLVMESREGLNKSSAWRVLAGDQNFSDERILGKESREVLEQLTGIWIHENADLAGMRKAEVEQVKAYLSRQVDIAREAYARTVSRRPRRSIEVGTTNSKAYLQSQTGNRRYWPLPIHKAIDLDALRRDRLQLWGEAAHYESAGESIELPEELWAAAGEEQEERRANDPWENDLGCIPDTIKTGQGTDEEGGTEVQIVHIEDGLEKVSSADLLTHVLRIPLGMQNRGHAMRLAEVMKLKGWERTGEKMIIGGNRVRGYFRKVAESGDPAHTSNTAAPPGWRGRDIPC